MTSVYPGLESAEFVEGFRAVQNAIASLHDLFEQEQIGQYPLGCVKRDALGNCSPQRILFCHEQREERKASAPSLINTGSDWNCVIQGGS
jgi:hypothetical protein